MQVSKIQFSQEELNLAENAEWILTKNGIIRKIMSVFGTLADEYRKSLEDKMASLPQETFSFSPKISRGEQYQGLPYVMLDYPRVFSKDDVFAVRSFFWWGNYTSLTLHVKGRYKDLFLEKISKGIQFFSEENYSVAISDDEWRHDFEIENYTSVKGSELLFEEITKQKEFIKLAKRWPIRQANQMVELFATQFANVMNVLTT